MKKSTEIFNYGKSICNIFGWDTVKIIVGRGFLTPHILWRPLPILLTHPLFQIFSIPLHPSVLFLALFLWLNMCDYTWPLALMGWRGEWIHWKKKVCNKNHFSSKVEWNSKNLWKIISAECKNQYNSTRIKRTGGCILYIFRRSTFKAWNTLEKGHVFFIYIWLVFHPAWYWPLGGGGRVGGLLNGQNRLSLTKFIFRWSLMDLNSTKFTKLWHR